MNGFGPSVEYKIWSHEAAKQGSAILYSQRHILEWPLCLSNRMNYRHRGGANFRLGDQLGNYSSNSVIDLTGEVL